MNAQMLARECSRAILKPVWRFRLVGVSWGSPSAKRLAKYTYNRRCRRRLVGSWTSLGQIEGLLPKGRKAGTLTLHVAKGTKVVEGAEII